MTSSVANPRRGVARIVLALVLAAIGVGVASSDPPGGAVLGFLLMVAALFIGTGAMQGRQSAWARRIAVAAGVVVAAFAAFFIHLTAIEAPLFVQTPGVPSVSASASSARLTAAIARARSVVRAAVVEQNLPGVSVAVGTGGRAGTIVWAEGFGWRDVVTQTPVTPETRFNIGTAARAITPALVTSLGLTGTGTDTAADWSPEHVGEPEEDFPGFTAVHDLILRPLGLSAPRQPLPGNRATFYVPATFWHGDSTDPRNGRRLMYMRDLACCAGKMSFYSTPSDLVRVALATDAGSVNGELAGGSVMSLVASRESGVAVAVTSNIAFASTAALAQKVADAFAEYK